MVVDKQFSVVGAKFPPNRFSANDITPESMKRLALEFLEKFRAAVELRDPELFDALIVEGGFWRDLIAFTNDFRSLMKKNVLQAAKDTLVQAGASNPVLSFGPKFHTLDEHGYIEFGFKFSTLIGPCVGTVRLIRNERGETGAFVLYTALHGIHGHPEQVKKDRIHGDKNAMHCYDDLRRWDIEDPKPTVLIVGGGHSGLTVAARLKYMGVRPLIIDRFDRVGDNWRKRYGSLALHDVIHLQTLPYMSWPDTFPLFVSAGKFANFLECYSEALELNVWTKTELVKEKTYFDEKEQKWHVSVDRDGKEYEFDVSHLVVAQGLAGGKAKLPEPLPGQHTFKNPIIHSSQHVGGAEWKGKKVLVVGTGASGHDISLDLIHHGADVTLLQRSPTYIHSIENGNLKTFAGDLIVEGVDLDYADQITEAMPRQVVKAELQRLVPRVAKLDEDMLAGLNKAGFRTYLGPDNSGHYFLSMERGGGFYFDSGCAEKIINGEIKMKSGHIKGFSEEAVLFSDGTSTEPDLVIFCTGYTGFRESTEEILGKRYTKNLKKIWGGDIEGEFDGLFKESGVPKTYFMGGSLPLARVYSRMVALQILADQLGLLGPRYSIEVQKKKSYYDVSEMIYK